MDAWAADELDRIGDADELQIASLRRDGTPRSYVTIWVVRVDDRLYLRSYRGSGAAWYRHAVAQPRGRIRVPGLERDVTFVQPTDPDHEAIDRAFRSKYKGYSASYVEPMVSPDAIAATLELRP